MLRKSFFVLATLFALVAATATASLPANADPSPGSAAGRLSPIVNMPVSPQAACWGGYLCFWVDTYYEGAQGGVQYDNRNWAAFPQSQCRSGTWTDCASSLINAGNHCDVELWNLPDYREIRLLVRRGDVNPNLVRSVFNDAASSNRWVYCQ
jgi:hypothetical protein